MRVILSSGGGKVLGESFASPDALKAALEAFTADWNTLLAHPFRWTYDGEGLHQKAVRRFTHMLRHPVADIELRILTKQQLLATNLLRDYLPLTSRETWAELDAALVSQHDALAEHIQAEPGPQRKLKAQQALAGLRKALDALFSPRRSVEVASDHGCVLAEVAMHPVAVDVHQRCHGLVGDRLATEAQIQVGDVAVHRPYALRDGFDSVAVDAHEAVLFG